MNSELRSKKFGWQRFLNSFKYSMQGLKYAYLHEQSMFIHTLATILSVILCFVLKVNRNEWIIIISLLCFIAVIELLNTSIEAACDAITDTYHPLIKIAKDTASSAVFLVSIVSLVVGLVIFVPKIIALF